MGTISQKLTYLNDTKGLLKEAINDVGGELTDESTFRSYAEALDGVYDNLPKITPPASNELYFQALRGRMDKTFRGDISQDTSILPDEYTEVDYIESTGTQWIDLNCIANARMKVEIKYMLNINTIEYNFVSSFGARDTNGFFINNGLGRDVATYWYNNANYISLGKFSKHFNIATFDTPNGMIKNYNDTTKEELSNNVTFSAFPSINLYLFARNNNGTPAYAIDGMKCWYCKIYDNNILVRDYIPCYRKSDGEVGLYDLVNGVFYTNQGTGAFTYGSVVTRPSPDYPQDVQVVKGNNTITINNIEYSINLGDIELCKIDTAEDYIKKSTGKNLFNKDTMVLNGGIASDTGILSANSNYRTAYASVKPNKAYTISKNVSSRFIVSLYNGTNLIMPITTTNPIVNNNASSMTVITNNDTKYIFVTYASGTDVANDATIRDSIQIEER